MVWAIVILSAVSIALLIYLLALKHQLREMSSGLERTSRADYDRLLLIQLFDKDASELACTINRTIDNQRRLKIDAEQAELALKQSVSDIAHDLRTPMAVIKGDLQLILRDTDLSPKSRSYAEICLEKTGQLKTMTDEFFELAVLESDRAEVTLENVDMTRLLMQFIAENEGVITSARLEPDISFPPKTVFVQADEGLVRRMLGNLLGNVLKYSRKSFTLKLSENGSVSISNPVHSGDISAERLFERTYRGDKARGGGGAGLGLYIVRLLAEKQGGEVSADVSGDTLTITIKFRT